MIADYRKRLSRLQQLRDKHGFGIPRHTLEASARLRDELTDKEAESQVTQTSPSEMLGLLENVPQFDLKEDVDLGSTPEDELQRRHQDMLYRSKWLKALLGVTLEEMQLLEQAMKKYRD